VSSPADSFVTATTRTQETASSVLRSWADGLQNFAGGQSALPDLPAMVAMYFDTMHQMLDSQRQFAETLLRAAQTTQDFMNQAARAAEQTADAAHTAAKGAATMTRAAKEQTSAMARAAKAVSA
jgi:methyl-accepting chemotaxis protein